MSDVTQADLLSLADQVLLKNYRQQPIVLTRGKGVELWDVEGNRFLDMTAGISVCCLGHSHPRLAKAIAEQAGRLLHTSNLYFIEQQILAGARHHGALFRRPRVLLQLGRRSQRGRAQARASLSARGRQ